MNEEKITVAIVEDIDDIREALRVLTRTEAINKAFRR
jgi:hypothetical protein